MSSNPISITCFSQTVIAIFCSLLKSTSDCQSADRVMDALFNFSQNVAV
jgi:hypothetical protein